MIVRVSIPDDPFARVRKAVLADTRLSWKAKGILAYLLGKPGNWSVRSEDLVKQSTDGRMSVRAAFAELRACGYAKLVVMRSNGGYVAGKEWLITDAAAPHREAGFMPLGREAGFPTVGKSASTKNENTTKNELRNSEAAEIYALYPKKVGRPTAIGSIKRALKKVSKEVLLEKTKAFALARQGSDPKFIPNPATWFNQERYNDDPSTWKPNDTDKRTHPHGSGRNEGTANQAAAAQPGGRQPLRSVRLPQ